MNTTEIIKCVLQDPKAKRIFKGVYPHDYLNEALKKKPGLKPAIFIINTHSSRQRGEHWVAVYTDGRGGAEYFDSFGLAPLHPNIKKFLFDCAPNGKIIHNHRSIQHVASNSCGLFVLHFTCMKGRGASLRRALSPFCSINLWRNDRIVLQQITPLLKRGGVNFQPGKGIGQTLSNYS